MTTVNPNSQINPLGQAGANTKSMVDETQDRFLTLLVTQLKNQDPLNPLDNAQVTSQLAQLSTVSGITELNNTLLALSGQMDMSQSMQAAALIGKDVLVPGDKIAVGNGVATPFGVDVVAPAGNVKVAIVDGAGKTIRTYDIGAQPVGVVSMEWDGLDDAGTAVPDGAYFAKVTAVDANGAAVTAGTVTYGKVNGVSYAANGLQLDLGLAGNVSLFDIRKVL